MESALSKEDKGWRDGKTEFEAGQGQGWDDRLIKAGARGRESVGPFRGKRRVQILHELAP